MNNIINLEESITKLFRSAIGDGYNEEEIEEMLADIDFHALSQAIFHNLETVYEYTVDCTLPFAMNYRGLELFPVRLFCMRMPETACELCVLRPITGTVDAGRCQCCHRFRVPYQCGKRRVYHQLPCL